MEKWGIESVWSGVWFAASHGRDKFILVSRVYRAAPETVIVAGFDLDEAEELFASCSVVAKNTTATTVVNEESAITPIFWFATTFGKAGPSFAKIRAEKQW